MNRTAHRELCAQMFTVRSHTQTEDGLKATLEKIAAIGYSSVQLSGLGPIAPRLIAAALRENNLIAAATHLSWKRFLDDIDEVIGEHRLWGCVHAAIGSLPGEYAGESGIRRFVDELKPVAARLAEAGLDFSYHNHNHEFVKCGNSTWLGTLVELAPRDCLNMEIDTYWIQAGGGDPAAWIKKCAGRIPLLHLKDMVIDSERKQRFAEIGEGNLNWPAILREAEAAGVEWYIVEQDDCYGRDPFESLAISYRNLKSMGLS